MCKIASDSLIPWAASWEQLQSQYTYLTVFHIKLNKNALFCSLKLKNGTLNHVLIKTIHKKPIVINLPD